MYENQLEYTRHICRKHNNVVLKERENYYWKIGGYYKRGGVTNTHELISISDLSLHTMYILAVLVSNRLFYNLSMYICAIYNIRGHKTSLTPPLFIEVPVPSDESSHVSVS